MIAAIVLAAGKSSRMGEPKALLNFRGHTFLERIIQTIDSSPIDMTIVVVGHDHELIEKRVDLPFVVHNPDYELGMVTSLQRGIRALPSSAVGVMVFLVDHPTVKQETIELILSRFDPARILLPVHNGKRGHPVVFPRSIFDELLALPPTAGANVVVRNQPGRVLEVKVQDPGILLDVDTREEFERLTTDRGHEWD